MENYLRISELQSSNIKQKNKGENEEGTFSEKVVAEVTAILILRRFPATLWFQWRSCCCLRFVDLGFCCAACVLDWALYPFFV